MKNCDRIAKNKKKGIDKMTLLLLLFGIAIKIVLPIVAIIFLIKGIKYLNQKNKDSKRELNDRKKD